MAHVSANVINDAFRGYEDDVSGGIASQTAIAAVDTNWSQDVDAKFHVAMLATETAGGSANNYNYRLEYNINSAGWNDVTSTSPIQSVSATNCTTSDAASYGTTALTTGATIQATEYDNGGADSGTVSLSSASFEYTTCLQIDSAQVANNDTIQLRLTNSGTALDADTTIPTITVVEATPDVLTADDVESSSNVTSPVITQEQALTANDVESSSELTTPVLTQVQVLLADDVESNSELTLPSASESHILLADDVESNSELSVPSVGQAHSLLSTSVESSSELTLPVVGQEHSLLSNSVESSSEISTPVLAEIHGLLADDVESTSELTLPTLAEASGADNLLAEDIESSSETSNPVITQVHSLLSVDIESNSEVSNPVVAEAGAVNNLLADNVVSLSQLTKPKLAMQGDEFEDFTMGSGTMMFGSGDHQLVIGEANTRNNVEIVSKDGRFFALDKAG